MNTDETKLTFRAPLRFTTLDGQPFELRAATLVLDAAAATLRFHTTADGYRRIVERELFNLYPLVAGDIALPEAADDIEIAARLRPELFADLRAAQTTDEAIAKAFGGGQSGALGALTATESWLAESVMAPAPPLPGVQGTIKSGGKTAWTTGAIEPARPPLRSLALAFFAAHDWPTEAIGDSLVRAQVTGEHADWIVLVRFDDAAELCTVASIFFDEAPEAARTAIAAELAEMNREIAAGAFDIDSDGEVRLRTAIFAGTDAATFERAALANLRAFDEHAAALAGRFAAH